MSKGWENGPSDCWDNTNPSLFDSTKLSFCQIQQFLPWYQEVRGRCCWKTMSIGVRLWLGNCCPDISKVLGCGSKQGVWGIWQRHIFLPEDLPQKCLAGEYEGEFLLPFQAEISWDIWQLIFPTCSWKCDDVMVTSPPVKHGVCF